MAVSIANADLDLSGFLADLTASGFAGDIHTDDASRVVFSTDNSIYELRPMAVTFPRQGGDLQRLMRAAAAHSVPLVARGGGTGTNGQSLTTGVVVDTSRYMNEILAFDHQRQQVTVGPGVVLDQLNAFLRPHGLMFPPSVSTASRATIGGMVATDASGKGSRRYGKTSAYIKALDLVLSDGSLLTTQAMQPAELVQARARDDLAGAIHREVSRVSRDNADEIAATFPKMNRGLTGYNLQSITRPDGGFALAYLLAGSEGTLALTETVTLTLVPRPRHSGIVVVRYPDTDTALRDVGTLLEADPDAVEFIDGTIMDLARGDPVWAGLAAVFGQDNLNAGGGLHVVEFSGDTEAAVAWGLDAVVDSLEARQHRALDWTRITDPAIIAGFWQIRAKAVGLLGRLGSDKQGVAFIEDAAVPPEHLADFVQEFRALLDAAGLAYGMYGHADVGCVHVRPALDMRQPLHAAQIRPLSDAVAALARRHGGLLWGEHGRGFRGEYSPFFFGPQLYAELCRIKAVFDPHNLLNPGKLALPSGQPPLAIDAIPFRGTLDAVIDASTAAQFAKAVACNGNGECHSSDAATPICPSFKATGDRRQSPKGRAALLRQWARSAKAGVFSLGTADFQHEVKASLDTCLSCKACATQCPVQVDIPTMKARFLDNYHRTVPRPLRDRVLSHADAMFQLGRRMPRLANLVLKRLVVRRLLERTVGLVDLPGFNVPAASTRATDLGKRGELILLEDLFTSSFDGATVESVEALLTGLGYGVHRVPPMSNGKTLHVLGYLDRFSEVARRNLVRLETLAARGLPVLGIEPATNLLYAAEYRSLDGVPSRSVSIAVRSVEQFLAQELRDGRLQPRHARASRYTVLLHCTEQTAEPETGARWKAIFAAFGAELSVARTGCCGMAGMFGHQAEHQSMSLRLFDLSWRDAVNIAPAHTILATGFSCRCQTERLADFRPRHPAAALLDLLSQPSYQSADGDVPQLAPTLSTRPS